MGRIQDPEGAKTVTMSFKTIVEAVLALAHQNINLICFADAHTGRLRVEVDAARGGKHDINAPRRRIVLKYMTNMHPGSTWNPELYTVKSDRNARHH